MTKELKTLTERSYENLNAKIAKLKDGTLVKDHLKPYYKTLTEIREEVLLEDQEKKYFEDLPQEKDGKKLIRVFARRQRIDFKIVSFKKIFLHGGIDGFTKILLTQDEKLMNFLEKKKAKLKDLKVQYIAADEENGSLEYQIGVYRKA